MCAKITKNNSGAKRLMKKAADSSENLVHSYLTISWHYLHSHRRVQKLSGDFIVDTISKYVLLQEFMFVFLLFFFFFYTPTVGIQMVF